MEDARYLKSVLVRAVEAVKEEGRGAVVELVLDDDDDVKNAEGLVKEVALREREAEAR